MTLPPEERVPHRPADERELVTGRGERGTEITEQGQYGREPAGGLAQEGIEVRGHEAQA
ncbi:hypothetical protein MOPEL_083_00610 [Mobilicoccus pelagius NBRC 104925]|uniref:Uncharacterized protein n=1 Tax=Mobilicoccus pelagius NBRC 104925 TaxID=1089455 RepID=H5USZ8_9MICO|nr:hypothetical protein MOPEL_083_00610 [Mobilicoccus pelagius NBRC 104925]